MACRLFINSRLGSVELRNTKTLAIKYVGEIEELVKKKGECVLTRARKMPVFYSLLTDGEVIYQPDMYPWWGGYSDCYEARLRFRRSALKFLY